MFAISRHFQFEVTVKVGNRTDSRAFHNDRSTDDRFAGFIHDVPCYLGVLSYCRSHAHQQAERSQSHLFLHKHTYLLNILSYFNLNLYWISNSTDNL